MEGEEAEELGIGATPETKPDSATETKPTSEDAPTHVTLPTSTATLVSDTKHMSDTKPGDDDEGGEGSCEGNEPDAEVAAEYHWNLENMHAVLDARRGSEALLFDKTQERFDLLRRIGLMGYLDMPEQRREQQFVLATIQTLLIMDREVKHFKPSTYPPPSSVVGGPKPEAKPEELVRGTPSVSVTKPGKATIEQERVPIPDSGGTLAVSDTTPGTVAIDHASIPMPTSVSKPSFSPAARPEHELVKTIRCAVHVRDNRVWGLMGSLMYAYSPSQLLRKCFSAWIDWSTIGRGYDTEAGATDDEELARRYGLHSDDEHDDGDEEEDEEDDDGDISDEYDWVIDNLCSILAIGEARKEPWVEMLKKTVEDLIEMGLRMYSLLPDLDRQRMGNMTYPALRDEARKEKDFQLLRFSGAKPYVTTLLLSEATRAFIGAVFARLPRQLMLGAFVGWANQTKRQTKGTAEAESEEEN